VRKDPKEAADKGKRGAFDLMRKIWRLLRATFRARMYVYALDAGWLSVNDVRRIEGLPPIEA